MFFRKRNSAIRRLHQMIDDAMAGKISESSFDETELSALETKFSQYLLANQTTKAQISKEKAKMHELISDISHQVKTPLANILLYAQILSERPLSQQDRDCVSALAQQAEKLHFLTASLLKVSRLESGLIRVVPTLSEMEALLSSVVLQAAPKAAEKGVQLTHDCANFSACFDPKWSAEALYNIVDNAIKYTAAGGAVHLSATAYQLYGKVDVADSGMGMREEESARVFTRFYRAPQASEQDGIGIGLYLSREIMQAQGGYIKLRSKPGIGSVFSLFFPLDH